jgi:hypothetical protein
VVPAEQATFTHVATTTLNIEAKRIAKPFKEEQV